MANSHIGQTQLGLLRASLIYAVGDLLTKGARIILVPYFVAVLTKPELGQLAILTAVSLLTWTLSGLGLPLAVQRQFFDYGSSGSRFVCSVWCWRLITGLPVLGFTWLVIYFMAENGVSFLVPHSLLACAITSGFLRGGVSVVESWFIVRQLPLQYRLFTVTQFVLSTSLIIGFVSGFGWGLAGAIIAELISWCLWTLLSGFLLLRESAPCWMGIRWYELTRYCTSALPHSLFMWGLTSLDRIQMPLLKVPLDRIGVYDVAYQLAAYLSIVTLAVRSAWLPNYFSQVSKQAESGHQEYGKTATVFFGLVLSASSLGVLAAPEIMNFLVKSATSEHVQIFRLIIVGGIGMACFIAFNQPFLSDRRVVWVAIASGTGLTINVVLNWWLIPQFGISGAAVSTMLSYTGMAGLMLFLVLKWYPIHWETQRVFMLLVGAIVCYAIAWYLGESAFGWSLVVRLITAAVFIHIVLDCVPSIGQWIEKVCKFLTKNNSDVLQL